jgi:hypothetical protein
MITTIIAAADPEIMRLTDKYTELLQRVSGLDAKITGLIFTAGLVGAILGYIGYKEVQRFLMAEAQRLTRRSKLRSEFQIGRINRLMEDAATRARSEANERISKLIEDRKKTLDAEQGRLNSYLSEAAKGTASIRGHMEAVRAAGQSIMIWESGDIAVEFVNEGYKNGVITFQNNFPIAPQVLICDGAPNAWLIVKVDEKHVDRFVWAATIVGGAVPLHKTTLQWIAVARAVPPKGLGEALAQLVLENADK